jgi:hypothetical protein
MDHIKDWLQIISNNGSYKYQKRALQTLEYITNLENELEEVSKIAYADK